MIKKYLKPLLQKSKFILNLLSLAIYLYLKFVYATSRWQFIWLEPSDRQKFSNTQGVIFALWHNKLAFGPKIFKGQKDTLALVSPHSDGRIISSIIKQFGFGVIEGSTNKNPVGALKAIIKKLSSGSNIVITPDGPRGPKYKINSKITTLASKYNTPLIPVACNTTRYFLLRSWDRLMMPLPFGTIKVIIGTPLQLLGNSQKDNNLLASSLMELTNRLL